MTELDKEKEKMLLEQRKVKALEKIANTLDALTVWVEEIEKQEWNELFQILKGQDYAKFNKKTDWNEQFDGTGLKGWWD